MSGLTQEEINQRRRQKILARSRKVEPQQTPAFVQPIFTQQRQEENAPLLNSNPLNFQAPSTPKSQKKEQTVDAFTRFRQLQVKQQRQKYLIIFAKCLGILVGLIQLYLMSVLKSYEIKFNNRQLTSEVFERVQEKFIDQLDLIYWACFGTIVFTWVWIKFVKSSRKNTQKIEIVPGSTMVTVLEQLNKVLEYKVLIKAVLGYTFSCIVLHLIMNQLIIWLGFENSFFKPNLAEILKPVIETIQNQEIL